MPTTPRPGYRSLASVPDWQAHLSPSRPRDPCNTPHTPPSSGKPSTVRASLEEATGQDFLDRMRREPPVKEKEPLSLADALQQVESEPSLSPPSHPEPPSLSPSKSRPSSPDPQPPLTTRVSRVARASVHAVMARLRKRSSGSKPSSKKVKIRRSRSRSTEGSDQDSEASHRSTGPGPRALTMPSASRRAVDRYLDRKLSVHKTRTLWKAFQFLLGLTLATLTTVFLASQSATAAVEIFKELKVETAVHCHCPRDDGRTLTVTSKHQEKEPVRAPTGSGTGAPGEPPSAAAAAGTRPKTPASQVSDRARGDSKTHEGVPFSDMATEENIANMVRAMVLSVMWKYGTPVATAVLGVVGTLCVKTVRD